MVAITPSNFAWLQQWYRDQCNLTWEHEYGITIKTLDNPGWSVTIDLDGVLYNQDFITIDIKESGDDWLHCSIGLDAEWLKKGREVKQFVGAGSLNQLERIIEVFRDKIIR